MTATRTFPRIRNFMGAEKQILEIDARRRFCVFPGEPSEFLAWKRWPRDRQTRTVASTSVKICPQNGSALLPALSWQCVQAFFPWLPVETDSFNRSKEAPAPRAHVCSRHITGEKRILTWKRQKGFRGNPSAEARQELDFPDRRKNALSLCVETSTGKGTRGEELGFIKGGTRTLLPLLLEGQGGY